MKKTLFLALAVAVTSHFAMADSGTVFESSFEAPKVTGRTPKDKGGDPTKADDKTHAWQNFDDQPKLKIGGITAGLTSEFARTGEQSLYVQADHLGVPYQGVIIASETFAVNPSQEYNVSIWGRNDGANGFSSEGPQIYMKLEVDFFKDDGSTQTGDSEYLLQPIPGAKGRKPLFTSTGWSQLSRRVTTPEDAKYMLVMWRWEAVPDQEPVSGTMYFDDVTVEGDVPEPRTKPSPTPLPFNASEPGAEATATPEATPAATEGDAATSGTTEAASPSATPTPTPATKKSKSKHKEQ